MTALLFTIATLLCSPQIQQGQVPPLQTRRMAERHSVIVRVEDQDHGDIASGLGLIVAEEQDKYFIATARHVIEPGREKSARIKVLPHGHVHWIEAEVRAVGDEEGEGPAVDYAFLSIPQHLTEFVPGALVSSFSRSPVLGLHGDSELWALGFDDRYGDRPWQPCKLQSLESSSLTFGGRIFEGFSGGPIVTRAGVVGMTIAVGPRGQESQAITIDHLATAAVAAQVPFGLSKPLVAEALRNCIDNGLMVSLCEHPANQWFALRVDAERDMGFSGRWVTYNTYDSTHGGGGDWTLTVEGERVTLNMTAPQGVELPLTGGARDRQLIPSSDLSVEGHLLMAERQEVGALYLALPRTLCETIPARLLASAADGAFAQVSLGEAHHLLTHTAKVRAGQHAPLSLFLDARDFYGKTEAVHLFQVPETWVGHPIKLTSRVMSTDQTARLADFDRKAWESMPLIIVDDKSRGECSRIPRDPLEPNDHPIDADFELSGPLFQLVLRKVDDRQTMDAQALVLQAPVLSLEPQ